jgi:hypothetical protein
MSQTLYFQHNGIGIELRERQFDGVENAQHRTLARIDLREALKLYTELGGVIELEEESARQRRQKDLNDKRAKLSSLREEIEALESELAKN